MNQAANPCYRNAAYTYGGWGGWSGSCGGDETRTRSEACSASCGGSCHTRLASSETRFRSCAPTTAVPTTAGPTTAVPTTAGPTTSMPTTVGPTLAPSEDPCRAFTCVHDCHPRDGLSCGWDGDDDVCATGETASRLESYLNIGDGDCPLTLPPTRSPITSPPTTSAPTYECVFHAACNYIPQAYCTSANVCDQCGVCLSYGDGVDGTCPLQCTAAPTTAAPTPSPTRNPTANPTANPTRNPTANPAALPTRHACNDGSHHCDTTDFGICEMICDGGDCAGHRCSCANTHLCSDGDCTSSGHTCDWITTSPAANPTQEPTAHPTAAPTASPTAPTPTPMIVEYPYLTSLKQPTPPHAKVVNTRSPQRKTTILH